MPAPRSTLLLLLPLAACFTDGGQSSSPTTADAPTSTDPASTADATSSGATDAPTSAPTTGSSGDAPTTGTTGPATSCELAAECEAGTVELGAQCDSCGLLTRKCQSDCTWSPQICDEHLETCAYWVLPQGAKEWQRHPVDPDTKHGPTAPIRTAFPLNSEGLLYALTDATFHVLDTVTHTWVASGDRAARFPDLGVLPIYHGDGFTADGEVDSNVTLVAGEQFFAYQQKQGTGEFALVKQGPCCGDDWSKPDSPDFHQIRDSFGELQNLEGWAMGDVQALCMLDAPTPFLGYSISITDDLVHQQEVGHCFDFFPAVPYATFVPFSYPGAPRSQQIGGAAWLKGLWVLRE